MGLGTIAAIAQEMRKEKERHKKKQEELKRKKEQSKKSFKW